MDEKPTKKRSRWPVVVMALVLLLPPLYVASIGPGYVFVISGQSEEEVEARCNAYNTAYFPIFSLCDRSDRVSRLVGAYQNWCARASGVDASSDYVAPDVSTAP